MMPPTEKSAALFGWHSQDSRATGPLDTADTVTAHYGTGGGNTPLIVQPCICIQSSMIGRAEKNGPQGDGLNQEVCFTLNTVDEHAVAYTFAEQNYSEYVLSPAGKAVAGLADDCFCWHERMVQAKPSGGAISPTR